MAKKNMLPEASNVDFLEQVYEAYLRDPNSVPEHWRRHFESLAESHRPPRGWRRGPLTPRRSVFNPTSGVGPRGEIDHVAALQDRVDQIVHAYRVRGHIVASVDPLRRLRPMPPELEPTYYGFTESDLDRRFSSDTIPGSTSPTLGAILEHLKNAYCRYVGVQYMHIDDLQVRRWIRDRMETRNRLRLDRQQQLRILTRLTDAVILEEFIQKKYAGAKSFSLEGAESLIPLLDLAIEKAGDQGTEEIVLAMAHRGRLNVLANVMKKSPQEIFEEFEDADPQRYLGRGDVKYHLGYSVDWKTASDRTVHLSLCFNPSHLEFVNPVALGRLRAKQDRVGDRQRRRGMALLIHGDASFAGEGIVQETLNLSELEAYTIGGAVHVVVNNQIGFTTPPEQGRSSFYATAVAKMLQSPIFHVNGENPEAVAQVVDVAMDFRRRFRRDVVIDMYCYRRRGHNEGDEPEFTQPVMYRAIEERKSVRIGYLEHLLMQGEVTQKEADRIAEERRGRLEDALSEVRSGGMSRESQLPGGIWEGYCGGSETEALDVETGVARPRLESLLEHLTRLPQDFRPHRKIERWLKNRRQIAQGKKPLDWSAAEALAFATLATEGHRVRLSGQDSERGTFSHRHAVLHDREDGHAFLPLQHLSSDQSVVEIYNSPLSEAGVLGFEYGYSLDCPDGLVLWEAQFGDFANAGQVVIDQFLSSAEDKWHRLSGIVLLLPHGFEGMGPEHSSARLEHFLVLAAEDNIQIAFPTTPAQYFHLLRRQVLRRWRKPLVVLTPKGLLRHRDAVSTLEDCSQGRFHRVIQDDSEDKKARRVLLCSGRIYYDLLAERRKLQRDVAIVRLEQLYPFPLGELETTLARCREDATFLWVQEEPENMGAWRFVRKMFDDHFTNRAPLQGIYRPESASPATGSAGSHRLEQGALLKEAFSGGRGARRSVRRDVTEEK